MSFSGVNINKIDGGLGGGESADRLAVTVLGCGEILTVQGTVGLDIFTPCELLQIKDAERLGITSERDESEGRLDFYHLSEIFRLSPQTRVWLIAVPTNVKASDLKNLPDFVAALRSIEGVNTIAVAGVAAGVDIATEVAGLQILVDNFAKDFIFIDAVLLEGTGNYLTATVSTYTNLRELASPNVSVIVGRDAAVAARSDAYSGHAAVGSALGMLLVRSVHENLGSVDIEEKPSSRKGEPDYTLTDVKTGAWLSASLSNGTNFNALSIADQKKSDELGYVYVGSFAGYGGFFFSNSHTCEEQGSDYCFIERNAVWNKAARIIRRTLIPRIRSKVEADPTTGFIKQTTITDWDGRVRKALEAMKAAGDVADFDIFISPKQSAVSTKPFSIKVKLIADGIVHEFDVDLGFSKSIGQ